MAVLFIFLAMKRPSDSLIYISVIAGLSLLVLIPTARYALNGLRQRHPMHTMATTPAGIAVYPSPNKRQGYIDDPVDTGLVLIEIMGGNTDITGSVVTSYGYTVRYISESVAPVTVAGDMFNVGCIASNNHSYRDDGNIFNAGKGSTSLGMLRPRDATLGKYAYVDVPISVSSSCQYIGTADGKWWWKVELN